MKSWLARRSGSRIGRRITLLVTISVLVSVVLIAAVFIFTLAHATLDGRTKSVEATAYVFAAAVADEVERNDRQSIFETLRAIARLPDISYAVVTDAKGVELASLGSVVLLQDDNEAAARGVLTLFTSTSLPVAVDIVARGEIKGRLIIVSDISDLRRKVWQAVGLTFLAAFLACGAGVLLALRLQRRITSPIVRLTNAMRDVRDTKRFTSSVAHTSDDETGALVESFNSMLSEINTRDMALIRHRETLEETVETRTHELIEAKEVAEYANKAKSSFLATMSHEIRTPLNGIMVMAELLAAGGLEARQQRYAEVIVRSGTSLLTIINDILDLSKIEAGKLELESIPLDPVELADDVISLFWEHARSKSLDLATSVAVGVPRRITGDPVRITQILSNLVNNALKFTPKGQVLLSITFDKGRLNFTVTDSGIGIHQDKINELFSAFTQADQSTTRKFGGTGLGLTICKRLSEAMGGEIIVRSEVGRGSSFCVSIPVVGEDFAPGSPPGSKGSVALVVAGLATRSGLGTALVNAGFRVGISTSDCRGADIVICDAPMLGRLILSTSPPPRVVCLSSMGDTHGETAVAEGTASDVLALPLRTSDVEALITRLVAGAGGILMPTTSSAKPRAAIRSFSGRRILVADDNAINREVLIEVLRQLRVSVDSAKDGREAIKLWRRGKHDLVFMDCSMPDMDGYAATREIRAHERLDVVKRHTPIVALTAHVAGSDADAWNQAGMDAHMTKPFTVAAISACLARFLDDATPEEVIVAASPESVESLLDAGVVAELKTIGGSEVLFHRVLDIFAAKAPPAVAGLKQLQDTDDKKALADAAHALKSMCANIGAMRAVNACHELEYAARTGASFDAGDLVSKIARELLLVLREVEALRAA